MRASVPAPGPLLPAGSSGELPRIGSGRPLTVPLATAGPSQELGRRTNGGGSSPTEKYDTPLSRLWQGSLQVDTSAIPSLVHMSKFPKGLSMVAEALNPHVRAEGQYQHLGKQLESRLITLQDLPSEELRHAALHYLTGGWADSSCVRWSTEVKLPNSHQRTMFADMIRLLIDELFPKHLRDTAFDYMAEGARLEADARQEAAQQLMRDREMPLGAQKEGSYLKLAMAEHQAAMAATQGAKEGADPATATSDADGDAEAAVPEVAPQEGEEKLPSPPPLPPPPPLPQSETELAQAALREKWSGLEGEVKAHGGQGILVVTGSATTGSTTPAPLYLLPYIDNRYGRSSEQQPCLLCLSTCREFLQRTLSTWRPDVGPTKGVLKPASAANYYNGARRVSADGQAVKSVEFQAAFHLRGVESPRPAKRARLPSFDPTKPSHPGGGPTAQSGGLWVEPVKTIALDDLFGYAGEEWAHQLRDVWGAASAYFARGVTARAHSTHSTDAAPGGAALPHAHPSPPRRSPRVTPGDPGDARLSPPAPATDAAAAGDAMDTDPDFQGELQRLVTSLAVGANPAPGGHAPDGASEGGAEHPPIAHATPAVHAGAAPPAAAEAAPVPPAIAMGLERESYLELVKLAPSSQDDQHHTSGAGSTAGGPQGEQDAHKPAAQPQGDEEEAGSSGAQGVPPSKVSADVGPTVTSLQQVVDDLAARQAVARQAPHVIALRHKPVKDLRFLYMNLDSTPQPDPRVDTLRSAGLRVTSFHLASHAGELPTLAAYDVVLLARSKAHAVHPLGAHEAVRRQLLETPADILPKLSLSPCRLLYLDDLNDWLRQLAKQDGSSSAVLNAPLPMVRDGFPLGLLLVMDAATWLTCPAALLARLAATIRVAQYRIACEVQQHMEDKHDHAPSTSKNFVLSAFTIAMRTADITRVLLEAGDDVADVLRAALDVQVVRELSHTCVSANPHQPLIRDTLKAGLNSAYKYRFLGFAVHAPPSTPTPDPQPSTAAPTTATTAETGPPKRQGLLAGEEGSTYGAHVSLISGPVEHFITLLECVCGVVRDD